MTIPETGKTLIGLYRLKKALEERVTESLFDIKNPVFMFISYTNSLVNTCRELSKTVFKSTEIEVKFSTLDKLILNELNKYCNVVISDNIEFRLRKMTMDRMLTTKDIKNEEAVNRILNRLGVSFLIEEITTVIEANDIRTHDIYKSFSRKGRGKALQEADRKAIWIVYSFYRDLCNSDNRYSWSGMRQKYLILLKNHQIVPEKVNCLVVDESQDMSPVALRIITYIIDDPNFLLLLADSGQSIYNKTVTWKNISNKFKFNRSNSIKLKKSYRMTKQVLKVLEPLRNDADIDKTDSSTSITSVFKGENKPFWYDISPEYHDISVIKIVTDIVKNNHVNIGQIAIIVRSLNIENTIINSLIRAGFKVDIFNKKTSIDIYGDAIHIINVHSAKGLEFPYVIVPNISDNTYPFIKSKPKDDDLGSLKDWVSIEQRILYVALSRGQYNLWIISDSTYPSRFLSNLDPKNWNVVNKP